MAGAQAIYRLTQKPATLDLGHVLRLTLQERLNGCSINRSGLSLGLGLDSKTSFRNDAQPTRRLRKGTGFGRIVLVVLWPAWVSDSEDPFASMDGGTRRCVKWHFWVTWREKLMLTIGSFRQGTAALFGLAALSITAFGADKTVATVSIPGGCRSGIVTTNGAATGTIQLTYTYVGTTFPAGDFGCFDLTMAVADDTGSKEPTYPASLLIGQIGGQNVVLTPSSFTMIANGIALAVTGSPKRYTVAINPAVPNNPAFNEDGDTIVGNLQLSASDNQLRTVSTILVKILLVPRPRTA